MKAYRASILYFSGPAEATLESDGLLVVGPNARGRQVVQAVGSYSQLAPRFAGVPTERLSDRIIAPGFVDMHLHYPQLDVIGSPANVVAVTCEAESLASLAFCSLVAAASMRW